ncbi:unnamed protein product [Boreogadus saida]
MRKELSVDEETIFQDQRTSQRRVFQTVRSVNTLTARAAASSSSPIPGSGLSPLVMTAQPFQSAQGYRGKPVEKDEDEEEEGEEEEEEGGIVFEVRVSSTPEDRRERPRLPGSPLPSATDLRPPLFRPLAAVGAVSYASALRAELTPGSAPGSAPGSPCAVQPVAAGTAPPSDTAPSPVRPEGAAAVASAGAPAVLSSVQHPGKCQSSTYSTYTVTTCRILHPNDITQVTSSSQPVWSVAPPDPPSSLRTRPSTPVTPCRLNLGGSSCFPPRRPPAPPPHRRRPRQAGPGARHLGLGAALGVGVQEVEGFEEVKEGCLKVMKEVRVLGKMKTFGLGGYYG